jgi:hypothetical protein
MKNLPKVVQIPGVLEGVTTRRDNSLKITFGCEELGDSGAILLALVNKAGWCYFAPSEVGADQLEIPDVIPEFKGDKTPSQRLRAVLFVYWQQNKPTPEFDAFYQRKMNEIIEMVKEKLS